MTLFPIYKVTFVSLIVLLNLKCFNTQYAYGEEFKHKNYKREQKQSCSKLAETYNYADKGILLSST